MASPVKPADFSALIVSTSSNLCQAFLRVFLQMPVKLSQFMTWMLGTDGNISNAFRAQLFPAGIVVESAGASVPEGTWLECDGASYERAAYPELFTSIGTIYGSVDGTHFNVPDKRGRCGIGKGQLVANDGVTTGQTYTQGTRIGSEGATLSMANLPAEPPPLGAKTDDMLILRNAAVSDDQIIELGAIILHDARFRNNSHAIGSHDDNALGDLGSGTEHENRGPSLVFRYWISTGATA